MGSLLPLLSLLLSLLVPHFIHCSSPPSPPHNSTLAVPAPGHLHHYSAPLTRLAFGSCNRQNKPQPLWSVISSHSPGAFVHLGDTVYADRHFPYLPFIRWAGSPSQLQATFHEQAAVPAYQSFLSSTPLLATWDDHDYGENDGDAHTPHRDAAQRLFLDFLHAAPTDVRRTRPGLYSSYTFGPRGQRVKVILLDLRYFQEPSEALGRDMLGEVQWQWLREELDYSGGAGDGCDHGVKEGTVECERGARVKPDFLFIGSSIQFGALQSGAVHRRLGEGWRHFPQSRHRLLQLLHQSGLECPVLFLSGDVHYAEVFRSDHCDYVRAPTPRLSMQPVVDVTSSGLTHSIGRQVGVQLTQAVMPGLLLGKPKDRGEEVAGMDRVCTDLNFGLVDIDWQGREARVRIMGTNNTTCLDVQFAFSELSRTTMDVAQVKWPGWKEGVPGPHPLSTSAGGLRERLARCEYEEAERGVKRAYLSGLKGLVSLAGGIALALAALLYFALRMAAEAVAWVLRRLGMKQTGRTKKRQ